MEELVKVVEVIGVPNDQRSSRSSKDVYEDDCGGIDPARAERGVQCAARQASV
jgi:hypothetical protein